jgi:ferritin-like metal-binding protein YciE
MNENSEMEEICYPQFLTECLKRVYWAEKHFMASLTKTIEAASSNALKETLESHFNNTYSHIITKAEVFGLKKVAESEISCKAMAQIIAEVDKIIIETE